MENTDNDAGTNWQNELLRLLQNSHILSLKTEYFDDS